MIRFSWRHIFNGYNVGRRPFSSPTTISFQEERSLVVKDHFSILIFALHSNQHNGVSAFIKNIFNSVVVCQLCREGQRSERFLYLNWFSKVLVLFMFITWKLWGSVPHGEGWLGLLWNLRFLRWQAFPKTQFQARFQWLEEGQTNVNFRRHTFFQFLLLSICNTKQSCATSNHQNPQQRLQSQGCTGWHPWSHSWTCMVWLETSWQSLQSQGWICLVPCWR